MDENYRALWEKRFLENMHRHKDVVWENFIELLEHSAKIQTVKNMEDTGGEPDVIGQDQDTGEFIVCDCSEESPKGRRSLCYDKSARESRKEHAPKGSAVEMAEEIGVEILSEEEYRALQTIGTFDLKTSSWIKTPTSIRTLGGALFCDRRYQHIFTYHNGAESYYAARGFRGIVRI